MYIDTDIENRCVDLVEVGKGERMNWVIGTDIYALPCLKEIASKTCCIAQRTQLSACVCVCVCVCVFSLFSHVQLFSTLLTVAHQIPLSMGIFLGKNIGVGCYFLPQTAQCLMVIQTDGKWDSEREFKREGIYIYIYMCIYIHTYS